MTPALVSGLQLSQNSASWLNRLNMSTTCPYEDGVFDVVLSVGVLEHVPNDLASLAEIKRVLKPGGLFFCFFLPIEFSWTQKIAHLRGNNYHDRLYSRSKVQGMLASTGLQLLDLWYRQILPKNTAHYPNFRLFEKFDQLITERTPLRYFATNIEFVCVKPQSSLDLPYRSVGDRAKPDRVTPFNQRIKKD
jgi:SAM-dependent methyltransferase